MKIQFASDLHLEFRDNWRYLRDNGPMDVKGDILVLAGDTGYLGDDMYSVHPFWNWASNFLSECIMQIKSCEIPIDDLNLRRTLINFYSDLQEVFEYYK